MFEGLVVCAGYLLAWVAMDRSSRNRLRRQKQLLADRIPELLRRASSQLVAGQSLDSVIEQFVVALGGVCPPSLAPTDWLARLHQQLKLPELLHLQSLVDHVTANGGDLVAHLDQQAERLQAIARARSMANVAMAPIKSQARLVLVIIPSLVLMVYLLEPAATSLLFTTYSGLAVLGICGALNVAIWLVFNRMGKVVI